MHAKNAGGLYIRGVYRRKTPTSNVTTLLFLRRQDKKYHADKE